MSLQISKNNGVFHLIGKLNTSTIRPFNTHFEHIIEQSDVATVLVNIDSLNQIDMDGFNALKTLKAIALRNQKRFYIYGDGFSELYNAFQQTDVA
jgi:ABC-type transporter Mla MlaB component